ncbi:MAG TPA: flagellar basal-body MS-ring/collar protein FliF [Bryobacteraceae bacterium]|nr:flagellar basal-body MS-ring/collar protein FliF [Bryobacteraceae bacterium]
MDQLRKLLKSLSLRQRFTVAGVAIAAMIGILSFVHWNKERDFKPLYSSLSPEDAGAVVAKLKEGGEDYRLHDGDSTILVRSAKIAELRLQMATAGIPKSGRIGYELFDKTNLGATDFTEQVNYHRAIEGELERSVMAMSEVAEARVHITFPKESVFTEEQKPAKASVMVKLKPGAKLPEANAGAIAQLVSSAVEGLGPESVSVMDMRGDLLIRPKKPGDGSGPSDEVLQYKKKLENETEAKITAVLDPLLGSEKYRASVDIDCDLTSGEQSEETFDPSHSVLTSSQRSEEGSTARETTAGVPGTQSNLPRPTFRPPTAGTNGLARRSESMAYETSRTVRRIRLPQGIVHRMSVSVLVDQNVRWEVVGKGKQAHPQKFIDAPSAERMKTIQAVIAAAVGVNTNRGDQLTVETLPFAATLAAEPPAAITGTNGAHPAPGSKFSPAVLGGIGGGVLLAAVFGFFFLKKQKKRKAQLELQAQLAAAQAAQAALPEPGHATEVASVAPTLEDLAEALKLPPAGSTKADILTRQVNEQAHKDPAALAQIVRTWLNEPVEGSTV